MALIKGITVALTVKTLNGVDEFNTNKYTETIKNVDNVLVAPTDANENISEVNLYGKKSVYTLAIPKGDTNEWDDTTVEFFGKKWRTFGASTIGIEENIPLEWNRKVKVAAYE